MTGIYLILVKKLAKDLGIISLTSIFIIFVCHGFGFNLNWVPTTLGFIAFYLSLFTGPSLISKAPWLFYIPLKRIQLILLSALLNISSVLFILVWTNFANAFLSLLKKGNFELYLDNLTQTIKVFTPTAFTYNSKNDLILGSLITLNLIVIVWQLAGLIFLRLKSKNMFLPSRSQFLVVDAKKRRKNLAITFFICLFLLGFGKYVWFGLSISVLAIYASTLLPFIIFNYISGTFGQAAKYWRVLGLTIFTIEAVTLMTATFTDLHSTVLTYQIDAHFFLGGWTSNDKKTLSRFLVSDIPPDEIRRLGEEYKGLYADNKTSGLSGNEGLLLSEAVQNKRSSDQLFSVLKIFDRKSLTASQLIPVFAKVNATYETNKESFVRYALPAKLSTLEVIEFINSQNPIENRFGILRARYFPDKLFVSEIEKNMVRYPDDLKRSALLTLSVIGGRQLGMADYVAIIQNRKQFSVQLASFDCQGLKKRKPEELNENDRPILNFCLRLFVREKNTDWIDWVEWQDWFASPIYASQIKSVKELWK